ncbi:MAG: phage tail protein, partial [Candidatus Methylomirabilis sp.]|nr:phage tail protein [Deltaproteobacteria bacterium]
VEAMFRLVFAEPIHRVFVYLLDHVIEGALPHLAWGFGVLDDPLWERADTAAKKRAFLKEALLLKRRKGTPWSIRRALAIAGWTATIQHRFPPVLHDAEIKHDGSYTYNLAGRRWAHFDVTLLLATTEEPDAPTQEYLRRVIRWYKPASRRLRSLILVPPGVFEEDFADVYDPGAAAAYAGAAFAEGYESAVFEEDFADVYDPGAAAAPTGAAFEEAYE